MKLRFKDVLSNPYRDLKGNPLLEEKLESLVESILLTTYWDNVVCRKNKDGKYELAHGHHRVAAAIRAGLTEGDFIVRDFTDAQMIQSMDLENREVYASRPTSLIESVKAVVHALAEGSIPQFEIPATTPKNEICHAPSFVPGLGIQDSKPYTAVSIAKFLGRTVASGEGDRVKAQRAIVTALNALHLKELGHFPDSLMVSKDRTGAPRPATEKELYVATSEIKRNVETVKERENKTAAEITKIREAQLAVQAKAKADAEKAEAEHKDLLKKEADARREENNRKADALAKQIKEKDERAKAKEVNNQIAMAALEEKLAQKKAWESEQRIQDAYLPIRRDVESMIGKFETLVSERNSLREDVKALAKLKALRPEDRKRLRTAAAAVGDWFSDWVAAQFAPLPTAKTELKEMAKKEKSKRKEEQ